MARGHEIKIASETRDFETGIRRGVIDPLEDAERSLDQLGDAADDAGRDAARGLDRLEDALKDAQRQSEKTEKSIDDIGDGGGKSFGKLGGAAQEVTQEVGQNLGEAVSSVRGDISDLGQVGQDTLGGLAATLSGSGPAGIAGAAALAAGAVGLGLITAEVEKQNERVQALKGYFADAWKEAVDGGRDYIDQATIISEMQSIMFDTDRADELKQIQEDSNALGLDRNLLLRAAAGDQDALNVVTERGNELHGEAKRQLDELGEVRTRGSSKAHADAQRELNDIGQVTDRWGLYGQVNEENRQKAVDTQQAISEQLLNTIAKTETATEEVDKFGNKLITLPDGEQVLIEAKTGQASKDIDKFEEDLDGIPETVKTKAIVEASTRAAQNEINRFVEANDGRSFTVHGRFQVDNGGWNG